MKICLHMQETGPEISSLCKVTKQQLDLCNFCKIMQRSKFTGGSNKYQHRVRLSGTSQIKFSARMISQLVLRKCCRPQCSQGEATSTSTASGFQVPVKSIFQPE